MRDICLAGATIGKAARQKYQNCAFSNCSFRQAIILGCEFVDCTFRSCIISHVDVSRCHFLKCSFVNVGGECAEIRNSSFILCNFDCVRLEDADICYCNFDGGRHYIDFSDSGMPGTRIVPADGTDLTGVWYLPGLIKWHGDDQYLGYRYGDRARMGCQEHSIEEWKAMTRADVSKMAPFSDAWYARNWSEWMEFLSNDKELP